MKIACLTLIQCLRRLESEGSNRQSIFSLPYQSLYPIGAMCLPPVTVRVWPVIVSALSEVRNTIAFATSSGIASHLKGLFSAAQDQKPSNSKLLKPAYQ